MEAVMPRRKTRVESRKRSLPEDSLWTAPGVTCLGWSKMRKAKVIFRNKKNLDLGSLFGGSGRGAQLLVYPWPKTGPPLFWEGQEGRTWSGKGGRGHLPSQPDQPNQACWPMAGTDVAARQPSHERMVPESSAWKAETRNLRRKERLILTTSRGGFYWAPHDSIGLPKRTHRPHSTRCFRYDILYKPWNTVGITKGAVKMRGLEGTCMLLKPWDSDQSQTQLRSKKATITLAFVVRIHVCSYTLGVFPFWTQ